MPTEPSWRRSDLGRTDERYRGIARRRLALSGAGENRHGIPCRFDADVSPERVSEEVATAVLRVTRHLRWPAVSEISHGPDWWVASDGLWYPPEHHPDYRGASATADGGEDGDGEPDDSGLRSRWVVGGVLAAVVVAAAIAVPLAVLGGDATPVSEADVDLRLLSVSEGERFYSAMAAVGDALVIVGYEDLDTDVATVWSTEDDGVTLEPIGAIGVVGKVYPYQVIETDAGLLAVGELFYADAQQADPLVMESANGDVWQIVANPNLIGGDGYEYFADVTPTGDGFVAARHRIADDGARFTTLWGSSEGRVWAPNGFTGIEDGSVVWGISRFDDGFVAVGSDGGDQPRVWISGDRRAWTEVATAGPLVAPDGAELLDVVAVDGGLVAVGSVELDGPGEPLVLVSDDALGWTRSLLPGHTPTPTDEVLLTVVDGPDGLRALGKIDDRWGIWAIEID